MKKINQCLDGFDGRFTKLESSVEALGVRLKPIEDKEDEVMDWKKELDSSIANLVTKVDVIEQLAGKVDSIDELHQQISNINNKLDRVVLD
jgi:chaperonin cofactor prefoldin